jgi:YVTN family beta-propeller protein
VKDTTDGFSRFYALRIRRQRTAALPAGLCLGALAAHAQNGPFLYVPNSGSSNVSVVDTSANSVPFAPIPVGPG